MSRLFLAGDIGKTRGKTIKGVRIGYDYRVICDDADTDGEGSLVVLVRNPYTNKEEVFSYPSTGYYDGSKRSEYDLMPPRNVRVT